MNDYADMLVVRCRQDSEDEPEHYVEQRVAAEIDTWTADQIEQFLSDHDSALKDLELTDDINSIWRCARHREGFFEDFNKFLAMSLMRQLVGYKLRGIH
jgi:hypothetical protein